MCAIDSDRKIITFIDDVIVTGTMCLRNTSALFLEKEQGGVFLQNYFEGVSILSIYFYFNYWAAQFRYDSLTVKNKPFWKK